MAFHEITVPPAGLVADTRRPEVYDADVRVMHFTAPAGGATLGTLVTWGNHPETLGGDNSLLTSDFIHYLREGMEKGVPEPNGAQSHLCKLVPK